MSAALIDAIYTKLTADQTAGSFYTAVGGRIAFGEGQQDVALPHCVFGVVNDPPVRLLGSQELDAIVQIDIYDDFKKNGDDIMGAVDKLFTLMDTASVTMTGRNGVVAECLERGQITIEDDSVRKVIRIITQYRISGT